MAKKYTTNENFFKFLGTYSQVPNRDSTDYEEVGTGDISTTIFWFDVPNVIENTETLYKGNSLAVIAGTLTRTTHYTVDYDLGKITLTPAGVTALGTYKIFAEYKYSTSLQPVDSQVTQALESAEAELDKSVDAVFFDGTAATPDFDEITNETHQGQGSFQKVYTTNEYPINDATTTLNGAVSADDTTITVVSTTGFPSSGVFACEDDKVTYTGKTATTFTGCTSVSAHDDGETVTSFVVERSLDDEGNEPTWTVMKYLSDYDIDFESGHIRLNNTSVANGSVLDNFSPPMRVWNRVRLNYQAGYDQIPSDIVKCVHYIAASELFGAQMLNSLSRGTDGFNVEGFSQVQGWIDKIIAKYKVWKVNSTQP